jgi:hypothetical protein
MVATFRLNNKDYVVLSVEDYERLAGTDAAGAVDAEPFMNRSIARGLRSARVASRLTQSQLAAKLRKSQAMVSSAENGRVRVGERYVKAVLRACGLPADWIPPVEPRVTRKRSPK